MPRIVPTTDAAIDEAAAILRRGGLVGMPTETVYGLAGVATDPDAVAAIFAAKQRPTFNPLIAHLADADHLDEFVDHVPGLAAVLIEKFWPGPLTLVLPKTDAIPDLVTAGLPTVAVRCPDHPVARSLIEKVGRPLAAPSANRYMHVSPTDAAHVLDLGDAVDLILDAGRCHTGIESTVLGFDENDRPTLLRAGGLPLDQLTPITGPLTPPPRPTATEDDTPRPGPGMVRRHYAPHTPLRLIEPADLAGLADLAADADTPPGIDPARTALLLFSNTHRPPDADRYHTVITLTESTDTREAAAHLFAALRELDACGAALILATPAPDTGLGPAINDRLTRAATPVE